MQNNIFYSSRNGFSLLELLIVVAILAGLGAAGFGFYRNFVKNVEIQSVTKALASDLRSMRSKSMIGELDNGGVVKWGAHLVNIDGGDQYYELFATPTIYTDSSTTIFETTTLPFGITFTNPSADSSIDIIFSRISGATTAVSIGLVSEDSSREVSISSVGAIN